MLDVKAQIPEALGFLLEPAPYKVAYGGRGGSKSWGFARALLTLGAANKLRILCCREVQNSIQESVLHLLKEQIELLKLTAFYHSSETNITAENGTEFIFKGLLRNVDSIKSMEAIDICWVTEAHNVSQESWTKLIPTILKNNSEIWVDFNPEYEDDPTYKTFVATPPDGAIVREVSYWDNPWFPKSLRDKMEQDRARDKTKYAQVWLGKPKGSGRKIWTAFDKEDHVREIPMEEIAKRGNCYMSMDPHSHYYPFCAWVVILPKNERRRWPEDFHKHVYAEWPTVQDLGELYHDARNKQMYRGSLADMAREIHARDGVEYGITVLSRFIDTRYAKGAGSWNASTQTEGIVNLFSKPENGGLLFEMPSEKSMGAQKQIIHSDMLWNKLLLKNPFNEPSFSVSPSCKNIIASLMNHRLEEDSEKEEEKYKDPSDALRIAWAGFATKGYSEPDNGIVTGNKRSAYTASLGFV